MSAYPNTIDGYIAGTGRPVRARQLAARGVRATNERLHEVEAQMHTWLIAHSIAVLRVSLGAVFLVFGVLKFFPGVSPAQNLVESTTDVLMLGLVPGGVALVMVATMECVIGLCLITARAVRGAVYLLIVQLIGILSPLVLLTHRLFDGPHGAPTLEGQYVLKDLILVGAALVVAATVRGGRLTSTSQAQPAGAV